jgi:sterol desaturase/sphingolipid hydroxylase (fatty acid hydroxylase superfamily)
MDGLLAIDTAVRLLAAGQLLLIALVIWRGNAPFAVRASTVLLLISVVAYFYWMRRALHSKMLFRRAHATHHRSRTPTPWAAYSFAPIEAAFEAAYLPLVLLVAPLHLFPIFFFLAHQIARNAIGHSGHELMPPGFTRSRWTGWLTTTTHHDLHHSEGRHNFGLYFTWWDRLMGTEHPDYHARFDAAAKPYRFALR